MNLLSKDGDTMQKDTPILITGAGGFIGKNLSVSYTHLTLPTN